MSTTFEIPDRKKSIFGIQIHLLKMAVSHDVQTDKISTTKNY